MKGRKIKQKCGFGVKKIGYGKSLMPLTVAITGVLTAVIPVWVQAQSTDEPIQLETISVIASEIEPAITVPSLSEVKRTMRRVPGGANVIDSETYATGRASTVQDALGYSPGVFVQSRAGAEESRLSIRGSGIQRTFHLRGIKILQDGSRLNLADGGADFQAIEPLATRYIEVFRGGNALQYGSTMLGGAINFVTPTGYDAERFRARGEAGSFGYNRLMASSGGVHGSLDYFASVSRYSQDSFRDWAATDNWRMFSNAGYRITPDLETRFYLTYVKSDSQLPGNLTKAQLKSDPRQANAFSLFGRQKRDIDLIRVANRTVLKLGNSQQLEFSGFYSHKDLWHPIFQVLAQPTNDYGIGLRYINEMPIASYRNRFVLGFEPSWGNVMDNRFVNVRGNAGARTAKFDQHASSYVVYGENQFYLLPELSLIAGAQYTYTTRKQKDLFMAGGVDQSKSKSYQRFTPKAGLIYELNPDVQFFSNVSTSFEPPSFAELTSGPVQAPTFAKAQRAITFEVGSRGRLFNMAEWDVALYRAHVRNELLALVDPATSSPIGTANADKTVHQGIELGLDVELAKMLYLRQMYMFSDFKFDKDAAFGNNQLAGIPRHFYKAELTYRHADGYYIGPNVEWSPQKYYVDHANTLSADSYALLGFKIGKRSKSGFSWFAEARNLTDRKYAATTGVVENARGIDQAQFLPGDGRSFFAGLEYRM
ncbi:TonB-dependent receptor family protein [Nitrosomonas eutropha]|uniref:TonB-dependent receptor family protein n=1 Tax=Nitrosomonas eutropha TaxID=916 RepID=UPI00087FD8A7|nr:TonB-dependent receptor [Nitrosomonas eutropha]SCX26855.1 iron complex outermembrane recepter protein [Nitrosomonas eutropha]SEJ28366.1 iron complex outermembrane recepter protein [Nitrosomonas eutropha]